MSTLVLSVTPKAIRAAKKQDSDLSLHIVWLRWNEKQELVLSLEPRHSGWLRSDCGTGDSGKVICLSFAAFVIGDRVILILELFWDYKSILKAHKKTETYIVFCCNFSLSVPVICTLMPEKMPLAYHLLLFSQSWLNLPCFFLFKVNGEYWCSDFAQGSHLAGFRELTI